MCGFAGFVDFGGTTGKDILLEMANSLIHRGPDDSGVEILETGTARIGLGFRRLSIIDLSPLGHQPMTVPDSGNWVMLNGEIYNYQAIRNELIREGFSFRTGSDTEVVLQAYSKWGMKMLDRFIGMFSIVLADGKNNCVYLIRDRAGVKPLFYYQKDKIMLFASELKAFHKHPDFKKELDMDALSMFFMNGSIPAPYSIFKNTRKVEPGHWIKIDLADGTLKDQSYWTVADAYNRPVFEGSYAEAKELTRQTMTSAFNLRMVADVPVGVFLSGGYDSTAVAAILSTTSTSLNTFTIGFEDSVFNEAEYAKEVAGYLGINHSVYTCREEDAMLIVPQLAEIYDEPFGDPSAIPTTLLSRVAREHVTVALSADGGDELFAGYPRHLKAQKYLSRWLSIPSMPRKIAGELVGAVDKSVSPSIGRSDRWNKLTEFLSSQDVVRAFQAVNQTYTSKEISKLLIQDFNFPSSVFDLGNEYNAYVSPLNRILATEYRSYLVDDILQKVDRATMSCGLEGREPFLDHRLLELVAGFPDEYKIGPLGGKHILKDIVHDIVPLKIMSRPKMGFGIPIGDWLKKDLSGLFEDVLSDKNVKNSGILNPSTVQQLKSEFLEGRVNDIYRVWFVFVFQQWYQKWMA